MKRRLSSSDSASSTPVPGEALAAAAAAHEPLLASALASSMAASTSASVSASAPASASAATPPQLPAPAVAASTSASAAPSTRVSPERGGLGSAARAIASASATPAPGADERTISKPGVIVPVSGDGTTYGDECFIWTDLPMNKMGYRYAPCAPSPVISPAPHFPFYRTIAGAPPAPPVALSWVDRSAFLRVSPDALTATTDRGYRSARATVSVRSGTWYYEAVIVRGDGSTGSGKATGADGVGNPHVRVGWGRREAGLDAPVGADAYAYGLRDVGGEKVHISRARPYGRSFGTGDVVGCLITLPERPAPTSEEDPAYVRRWRIPLRYKGQLYFEMDEYPAAKEMEALVNREGRPAPSAPAAAVADDEPKKKKKAPPGTGAAPAVEAPTARPLPTLPGSSISFFLNGEPLGEAFSDIYDVLPLPAVAGEKKKKTGAAGAYERERESYQHHDDGTLGYFPMVSCFGRGKVRMNFGPDWMCPPSGLEAPPRPLCDRWAEARAEEVVYDERDEVALAEKLRRDMAAAAEAKADAVAAAASGAVLPQSKRSRDKKRKKGTPAPGEIATPGDGTPRDSGTPFEPTPASSPARARTDHTPFDDTATAASTPYDSPMAVDTEDHVKEEPRVGVGMGTGMEVDADGEAEDADPDPDADGEEDANEGVSWA